MEPLPDMTLKNLTRGKRPKDRPCKRCGHMGQSEHDWDPGGFDGRRGHCLVGRFGAGIPECPCPRFVRWSVFYTDHLSGPVGVIALILVAIVTILFAWVMAIPCKWIPGC